MYELMCVCICQSLEFFRCILDGGVHMYDCVFLYVTSLLCSCPCTYVCVCVLLNMYLL